MASPFQNFKKLLCAIIRVVFFLPKKQSADPNRFNNRGGQLQKQLKLRKQLEKELPRIEKELKTVILQWEEDHERHFIIHDTHFLDVMEQQNEESSHKREKEKIKKVTESVSHHQRSTQIRVYVYRFSGCLEYCTVIVLYSVNMSATNLLLCGLATIAEEGQGRDFDV